MITGMFAGQALERFLTYSDIQTVLDIGSGSGEQAQKMRAAGKTVTTISIIPPADFVGDYLDFQAPPYGYDGIWASHVLEHQPNVGLFLQKCLQDLAAGGLLAITVPPLKHEIVGGHLALFNQGLLIYNLVRAGFDCSRARVSPTYSNNPGETPYNISVLVRKHEVKLPLLVQDQGDLERLTNFFPIQVWQNFDGRKLVTNW